jgi:hypothetical protein
MPAAERAERTRRLARLAVQLPPAQWLAEQVDALG